MHAVACLSHVQHIIGHCSLVECFNGLPTGWPRNGHTSTFCIHPHGTAVMASVRDWVRAVVTSETQCLAAMHIATLDHVKVTLPGWARVVTPCPSCRCLEHVMIHQNVRTSIDQRTCTSARPWLGYKEVTPFTDAGLDMAKHSYTHRCAHLWDLVSCGRQGAPGES